MIVINVHGRLAHQPELKILGKGSVCEFRLLSSRFAKGEEVTEAVTFFCYDEEAEKFCESTEKGQLISATGTQETSSYNDASGQRKSFTKYRMNWYSKGPRPRSSQQGANQGDSSGAQRYGNDRQGGTTSSSGRGSARPAGDGGAGYGQAPRAPGRAYQPSSNEQRTSHAAPQKARQDYPDEHSNSDFNGAAQSDFDDVTSFV